MEHELLFTVLLNKLLAGILSPLLAAIGVPPADVAHPIPDYVAMEILVILLILAIALLVVMDRTNAEPAILT